MKFRAPGFYTNLKEDKMAIKKVVAAKKPAAKKTKSAVSAGSCSETMCSAPSMACAEEKVQTSSKKTAEYPNAYVLIDYPKENEVITGGSHYAVRIGASSDGAVELQINGPEWLPCRFNAGYWWYDMHDLKAGAKKITARLLDSTGKTIKKSPVCKVKVQKISGKLRQMRCSMTAHLLLYPVHTKGNTMSANPQIKNVPKEEENSSISGLLIFLNILAAAALVGIFFVAKSKNTPRISMDTIRKIYDGLSPDEME